MKHFKTLTTMALILAMVLSLAACGSTNETTAAPATTTKASNSEAATTEATTTEATTEAQAAKLEGSVIIDGSGTVYPLMAHIAEEYMTTVQNGVSVQVGRAGSSAGFKKFVVGETDFSDASRKIKDKEIAAFSEGGFTEEQLLEIKIALDGLTMVINKDNDWAKEMTKEEVIKMYISGSHNAEDKVLWSDIRPEWPAEEIKFYGPNENHGTYEFFYEKILDEQPMVKTASLQQEYSTLVDLVSKEKNAIAFFGFGYYVSNKDKIQAVSIDFGEGAVEPTLETIGEDLPYAGFTRPVFTYVNLKFAAEKPQVLDYAKYVVSSEGALRLAGENGFAPLPEEVYNGYMEVLEGLQ